MDQYDDIRHSIPNMFDVNTSETRKWTEVIEKKVQPKIPNVYNKRSVKVQYHPYASGNVVLVDGVVFGSDPSSALMPQFMRYMDKYDDAIDGKPSPDDYHFWDKSLYYLNITHDIEKDISRGGGVPASEMPISAKSHFLLKNSVGDSRALMMRLQSKRDTFKKSDRKYGLYNKLYKGAKKDYQIVEKKEKASRKLVEKAKKK